MKVKVAEASGPVLDCMVALALGGTNLHHDTVATWWITINGQDRALRKGWAQSFTPSSEWGDGGPIIAQHIFLLEDLGDYEWEATARNGIKARGDTVLEAVCRAYTLAELGDEVEVPEELLK